MIPSEYLGMHVLRTEIKIKHELAHYMGRQVDVADLTDEAFIRSAGLMMWQLYAGVQKGRLPFLSPASFESPGAMERTLAGYGLPQVTADYLKAQLDGMRSDIGDSKYYRILARIKEVGNSPIGSDTSPLVEELDRKLKESLGVELETPATNIDEKGDQS